MLAVIIVLAVVGTALSVFVDSKPWGPISLVLLIWGLVVAAFLLARYVRDLRAAEAKERDLKLVYELQLEREITARREYELTVERDLRADLRAESNTELSALKAEVLALRANLEELLGHDLGPTYSELYAAAQRRALEEARDGGYGRGERSDGVTDGASAATGDSDAASAATGVTDGASAATRESPVRPVCSTTTIGCAPSRTSTRCIPRM